MTKLINKYYEEETEVVVQTTNEDGELVFDADGNEVCHKEVIQMGAKGINYCVFDLETTDLNEQKGQIIEIGAVAVDSNFNEIARFQTFVDLYKVAYISDETVKLTSITMMDIEDAPEIEDALESFKDFLEKHKVSMLVAQNASFDMKFLYHTLEELDMYEDFQLDEYGVIDTITLAKNFEKVRGFEFEDRRLGTLATAFNLSYDSDAHHRADYDAALTAQLLKAEVEALDSKFKVESMLKNRYIYSTLKEVKGEVELHTKVLNNFE